MSNKSANSLASLIKSEPIPTAIEGVYVADLPAKFIEQKFKNIEQDMNENSQEAVEMFFKYLIVDKDGNAFDDVNTYDEIISILSIPKLKLIVEEVAKVISGSEVKNS